MKIWVTGENFSLGQPLSSVGASHGNPSWAREGERHGEGHGPSVASPNLCYIYNNIVQKHGTADQYIDEAMHNIYDNIIKFINSFSKKRVLIIRKVKYKYQNI